MNAFTSDLSAKQYPESEKICLGSVKPNITELILKDFPHLNESSFIAIEELNRYRQQFIENFMTRELGELNDLEKMVLENIRDKTTLSDKIEDDTDQPLTTGQKLSDNIARFGGSWNFIISFLLFMALWIGVNILWLGSKGFDPYPFILLNLILSCIAALQAPLIMMSQNRQEEKDRQRAKKDYMINLKSEVEIRMLHEKIDHLIHAQQQQLLEIQKIQIDMLNEIMDKIALSRDSGV